jgi:hypothetical protein
MGVLLSGARTPDARRRWSVPGHERTWHPNGGLADSKAAHRFAHGAEGNGLRPDHVERRGLVDLTLNARAMFRTVGCGWGPATLVLALGLLLLSVARADAYVTPQSPEVAQHAVDVTRGLANSYPGTNVVPANTQVGDQVTADIRVLPSSGTGAAEADAVRAEAGAVAERAGLMPRLTTFIGTRAIPAIGAFGAGFWIGTELNKHFFHVGGAGIEDPTTQPSITTPIYWQAIRSNGYEVGLSDWGFSESATAYPGEFYLVFRYAGQPGFTSLPVNNSLGAPCSAHDVPSINAPGQHDDFTQNGCPIVSWHLPADELLTQTKLPDDQLAPGETDWGQVQGVDYAGDQTTSQAVMDQLNTGSYPHLSAWLDHELDPVNYPDPIPHPGNIVVPDCTEDATFADCTARLDAAGLTSYQKTTLPQEEAVPDQPGASVVATSVKPGESVSSDTEIQVIVNPDSLPDLDNGPDEDDRGCDRSTPEYPVPTPPDQPDIQDFEPLTDSTLVDSPVFKTDREDTTLRWGPQPSFTGFDEFGNPNYNKWGYRHIRAGHGWSLADDADTRIALVDGVPRPSRNPRSKDAQVYYGPKYPGSVGETCRREVVVEYGVWDGEQWDGTPAPRGIITSFGRNVANLRWSLR